MSDTSVRSTADFERANPNPVPAEYATPQAETSESTQSGPSYEAPIAEPPPVLTEAGPVAPEGEAAPVPEVPPEQVAAVVTESAASPPESAPESAAPLESEVQPEAGVLAHEHELTAQELGEYRDNLEQQSAELSRLKIAVTHLGTEHGEHKDSLDHQSAELSRLKIAIAQLGKKLQEKDAELFRLQGMVQRSDQDRAVLMKELEQTRTEAAKIAHAMPVVIYDADENKVADVSLFAAGKGEALEKLLGNLVDGWQKEGPGVEVAGLPPHMAVRVKGDPNGRGFDLLPSSVLFLRLSRREREALGTLPPLVSTSGSGTR